MLNHSCDPNCVAVFNGTKISIKAVKKINTGDELTISYTELLAPTKVRQEDLKHQYFFDCCCGKCTENKKEDQLVNSYLCANTQCTNAVLETGMR